MLPDTLQTSTQKNHMNALSTYRTENVNGRDFLVVDGVALVEGVLNSRFVPYEEFEFAPDWNGVPVVVRHPKKNKGSARVPKPDVLEVGRFYNARTDKSGRRLLGEFWLDQTVMNNDPDAQALAQAVLSNRRVEVSTGYFSADEIKRGKYNGVDYISIDRNIRPDHIALLPDEMGACSIKDGCGLNRNAKQNCDECKRAHENHLGPGNHPSGSSQDVHGKKGHAPQGKDESNEDYYDRTRGYADKIDEELAYDADMKKYKHKLVFSDSDAMEKALDALEDRGYDVMTVGGDTILFKSEEDRKKAARSLENGIAGGRMSGLLSQTQQNAADQFDVSDDVAAFIRAAMRGNVRIVENHMGPGNHPSGSSQDVHGDGGGDGKRATIGRYGNVPPERRGVVHATVDIEDIDTSSMIFVHGRWLRVKTVDLKNEWVISTDFSVIPIEEITKIKKITVPVDDEFMEQNSAHEDYATFEEMYKENHPDADEEEIDAAWEKHKAGRKETPMEQNAADQLDVSDDVANFVQAAINDEIEMIPE